MRASRPSSQMRSVSDQPTWPSRARFRRSHGAGPTSLRPGAPLARCALRRSVLHRRDEHRHLLPPHLPRPHCKRRERSVLSERCRGGRRRLPPVPSLSPRGLAGHTGVARHIRARVARAPAHRRIVANDVNSLAAPSYPRLAFVGHRISSWNCIRYPGIKLRVRTCDPERCLLRARPRPICLVPLP